MQYIIYTVLNCKTLKKYFKKKWNSHYCWSDRLNRYDMQTNKTKGRVSSKKDVHPHRQSSHNVLLIAVLNSLSLWWQPKSKWVWPMGCFVFCRLSCWTERALNGQWRCLVHSHDHGQGRFWHRSVNLSKNYRANPESMPRYILNGQLLFRFCAEPFQYFG